MNNNNHYQPLYVGWEEQLELMESELWANEEWIPVINFDDNPLLSEEDPIVEEPHHNPNFDDAYWNQVHNEITNQGFTPSLADQLQALHPYGTGFIGPRIQVTWKTGWKTQQIQNLAKIEEIKNQF